MLCALLAAALLAPSQVMVAYVVPAAASTFVPLSAPTVVINEVKSNGNATDWVEAMNVGTQAVDISG